jgi:broad specificity phosphatase PhoE
MMATLYVLRHGNTFDPGDVIRRVGSRTDLPLSLSGRAQAEKLAAYFHGNGLQFEGVFCSPLQRTQQTAAAILARQARAITPVIESFLTEVDYGDDDGKAEADVEARVGKQALKRWDDEGIAPDGWHVDSAAIARGWSDFLVRLERSSPSARNSTTLVVTSNGTARFLLQSPRVVLPATKPDLKLRTAAFGIFECVAGRWHMRAWDQRP